MSLGVYSIFFFLISLPGLLFRRIYYSGEFAKQYTPKNLVLAIFYSMIIGIVVLYCSGLIYNQSVSSFFKWNTISSETCKNILEELYKKPSSLNSIDLLFDELFVKKILFFLLIIVSTSIVSSSFIYILVRTFKLDKRISFLRFSNHWYYYLRGEFLQFKQFKTKYKSIELVLADILVNTSDGNNILYTGNVSQYEIDKQTNSLDSIYLSDAQKKVGNDVSDINSTCLVIPYKNVLNINLRVVYTPKSNRDWFKIYENFHILLIFIFFSIPFFWNFSNFSSPLIAKFLMAYFFSTIPSFPNLYIENDKKIWTTIFQFGMITLFVIGLYYLLNWVF